MATNLTAKTRAQLQSAVDLLMGGSAYETPLSQDVIERIAPVFNSMGLLSTGGTFEFLRDRPYTGLMALVLFCGMGVFTPAQENLFIGTGANIGGALGLMYVGDAYERPFAADVIERLAPIAASTGFRSTGGFGEAIKLRPVSTMLRWAIQLGSTSY